MEIRDTEQIVIGCAVMDSKAVFTCYEMIHGKPGFFTNQSAVIIWGCIEKLIKANQGVDLVTVTAKLRASEECKDAQQRMDAQMYLIDACGRVGSTVNVLNYIAYLTEQWLRRCLNVELNGLLHESQKERSDIFDAIDLAQTKLNNLTQSVQIQQVKEFGKAITDAVMDAIRWSEAPNDNGISTGFEGVDNVLGRLMPGSLNVIGARPGMGKTAFVLTLAVNVAKQKKSVAFFSLEMKANELAARMLSMETGIPNNYIIRNPKKLTTTHKQQLSAATSKLNYPIFIYDEGTASTLSIKSQCRKLKDSGKLDLIVIDYLQIMKPDTKGDDRDTNKFYEDITRDLKIYAKSFDVPIILLCQLSRENTKQGEKRPQLSHLRGSGGIEQNADSVSFIHRESYYEFGENQPEQQEAEIIVAKNRSGATGTVTLLFYPMQTLFRDKSDPYQRVINEQTNDFKVQIDYGKGFDEPPF